MVDAHHFCYFLKEQLADSVLQDISLNRRIYFYKRTVARAQTVRQLSDTELFLIQPREQFISDFNAVHEMHLYCNACT